MSADPLSAVRAALAPEPVVAVRPLGGGACQENLLVELEGGRRLVLRSDAETSLPGSLRRAAEGDVARAAAAAGVPTPAPLGARRDLLRAGADAYWMGFVEGVALGAKVTRDPALEAARAALPGQLAAALAAIHRITPASAPDLPVTRAPFLPDADPAGAALAFLREMLDRLPEPRPACELALRWLRGHRPEPREVTLVHGDFRTGNFLVRTDGLAAVLDWEFAHWGSPVEDLAWIMVRDWRFGRLDLPVGGFAKRPPFLEAYTAAGGRAVDRADLHFWEVLGNLRWAAGALWQGVRARTAGDLELWAIPRRACEMEYEALRLIEVGPVGE